MKRYLGPLLCVLISAACSTNKPAEMPQTASTAATPSLMATHDTTPSSVGRAEPVNTDATAVDTTTASHANRTNGEKSVAPASDTTPATNDSSPAANDYRTTNATVAPDNTKVNKRDTKASSPTPLDQGEGQADLDITKKIRQAVVGDHSLSFTAKNVKIITRDGKVTLRGPVNTSEESQSIQAAAIKVAGAGNVDNQLEVKK